jgi:hypothetical protein
MGGHRAICKLIVIVAVVKNNNCEKEGGKRKYEKTSINPIKQGQCYCNEN